MTEGYLSITPFTSNGRKTWNQPITIDITPRTADTIEKETIGFTKKNNLKIINNIFNPSRYVDNLLTEP